MDLGQVEEQLVRLLSTKVLKLDFANDALQVRAVVGEASDLVCLDILQLFFVFCYLEYSFIDLGSLFVLLELVKHLSFEVQDLEVILIQVLQNLKSLLILKSSVQSIRLLEGELILELTAFDELNGLFKVLGLDKSSDVEADGILVQWVERDEFLRSLENSLMEGKARFRLLEGADATPKLLSAVFVFYCELVHLL